MKTPIRTLVCLFTLYGVAAFAAEIDQDTTRLAQSVTNEMQQAEVQPEAEAQDGVDLRDTIRLRYDSSSTRKGAVVTIGRAAELPEGQMAEAVVAIGGSARADGTVRDGVVAVGGNIFANGDIGDAAVAVGGNVTINGQVGDAAVAVLGNVQLGPHAVVNHDVVAVGGRVQMAKGAVVHGKIQEIDFGIPGLPRLERLTLWFQQCVLKLRPLAPQVPWVWGVAGVFFLLYLLVAIAFPKPVQICLGELTERPATTFFVGLLVKILVPILVILLIITGIGLLVVPFVFAAVFFAAIVGKVALLQYLGGAIGRPFGLDPVRRAWIAFLVGTVLLVLLYIIPIIGFLAYTILGMWGLGAAITGAFSRMSREKPRTPPPVSGSGPGAPLGEVPPAQPSAFNPPLATPGAAAAPGYVPAAEPPVHHPLAAVYLLPRAGFWERMGAGFLDVALLSIPVVMLGPFGLLFALAYFAGMWAWKGTTIGGVVLNHRVVRQDGTPLTFVVALVRGLAAAFSIFVLFLGFFWIGWDPEKQGWHDKIAGTCVVRLPRTMPLLCL